MSSNSAFGGCGRDQIDPFDPRDSNLWRKAEYLGRYLFAADFLRQHRQSIVADISCGMGYGTSELCQIAETVIGVDSSRELIETASKRSNIPNVRFLNKDLDCDDLAPDIVEGSVDAVVSFETLEHLIDPNRAVSQFSRILRPGGFLICSVPNVLYESGDSAGLPRNKSHKQWFSFGSLCRMVEGQGMRVVYRLGQSWSKALHRREQQLSNAKRIGRKLSDEPSMHSPEMIRWLSYVAAYPTVEDVDGSYSIIIVAQKKVD
ncbi:MAG TPA: class I SAM-dependent methyltransferase [Methanotrichaceae archaeon]|nr:class I SAM-dependent methyltransferase [Methanotrichaceae archaeon]